MNTSLRRHEGFDRGEQDSGPDAIEQEIDYLRSKLAALESAGSGDRRRSMIRTYRVLLEHRLNLLRRSSGSN